MPIIQLINFNSMIIAEVSFHVPKPDKIMKKILLPILAVVFLSFTGTAKTEDTASTEKEAIKAACLDYIEGWYTGNAERMERALHPNLVKRRVVKLQQTGGDVINQVTQCDMVEYTRAGFGTQRPLAEGEQPVVEILDIYKGTATVKMTSRDFIDYAHLARFNGSWKIMNVLWESKEQGN